MANLVRIKDKFQVTIPLTLRRKLAMQEGDYLEVSVSDNTLVLRPQRLANAKTRTPSLLDFLMEPRQSQRSRRAIDSGLAAERATWKK